MLLLLMLMLIDVCLFADFSIVVAVQLIGEFERAFFEKNVNISDVDGCEREMCAVLCLNLKRSD